MILRLRQRHRRMVITLGVLMPLVFAAGMALRKPVPEVDSLPYGLAAAQRFTSQLWQRGDLFAKAPVKVRLLSESTNSFALGFTAAKDFVKPDLLVYWVAGNTGGMDALPDNAVLLGGFDSVALPLPADAATTDGVLVLYSLADNEIVDVSKPARFGPAKN
jgi:hypothetical protein